MKIFPSAICYFCIYLLSVSSDCLGQSTAFQNININQNVPTTAGLDFNIPEPVGFVNDFENLFKRSEIKTLDSMIMDFNNKSSIQIAVITIDTLMIKEKQMNDFTSQTFKAWGLQASGNLNGILIGLSRGYKKIRIETGYGVEKVLSDFDTKEIIEKTFLPSLKDGKYYKGTYDGLTEIVNKLKL